MAKLCIFFVIALLANAALGMGLRARRQATNSGGLDDRYGWDWPIERPSIPGLNPNFPARPWPFPADPQPPQQRTTTTTIAPTTTGNGVTAQSPDVTACIQSCPVTPEYNPVCGSNFRVYDNPGRLSCEQLCGINVSLLRAGQCPATTVAPPS